MPNRLIDEKSPYLLQHAHNPVDWYPWGEEAFRRARDEDRPIFLSIGYSTCHWCHVMERESFENADLAALINRYFVPVKVDREERPDVDRIYMTFVQATTGSGGWPMSVFLTPDLKPFFGGTYFPPDSRYGHPGFRDVLERVAEAWRFDRTRVAESAADVIEQLKQRLEAPAGLALVDPAAIESGFYAFRRSFDTRRGGFGAAPKFPRVSVHNFLLRYYDHTGNVEVLEMVYATLNAMAHGGIRDHLGGGFHRYAVDENWFVPHFEKMLYDQAQIAVSYLEAYQLAGDEYYAEVARGILDYVLRDMTHPEGGFYSAEDADSAIDAARPEEKGEGAFYIWTREEIGRVLGEPLATWFSRRYGVEPHGNVRNDPHGEFGGKNILYEARTVEETAREFSTSVEDMRAALNAARRKLLEARAVRPRPHRDDKVLTAWNGLMISAFAKAAQALGEPRYLEAARRAAGFILAYCRDRAGGGLLRRFRDAEAAIPAFLDDYAFFVQGLLDLYETDFDLAWLETAITLTDAMRAGFEDAQNGGFFSTAAEPSLVLRMKDDYDGAEPSGNSIAALDLLRLAAMTGRADYRDSAGRVLRAFSQRMATAPEAAPQMLAALLWDLARVREIVVAGERDAGDTNALVRQAHRRFLPHKILLLADRSSRGFLASHLPQIEAMAATAVPATAYVCENYACRLPVTEPGRLEEMLATRTTLA